MPRLKDKNQNTKKILSDFYEKLLKTFGSQGWWPGRTNFEVIVGAILTQNTNWGNVERAIKNLKNAKALNVQGMNALEVEKLAELIRPSGYFNLKAKRLKAFLNYLFDNYGEGRTNLSKFLKNPIEDLRRELLSINGIGPETADSILLYAAYKPVFVLDAYTKRLLHRHGLVGENATYDEMQSLFMDNLNHSEKTFNEYHALIVRTGKDFCRPKKPLCEECPLGVFL
ncbi:MAG: endonuclease III domain-containing protein [Deltaproteobacteria bacterium]|nr:endonuclease III domain-containing protein [Deltaproteobacteria bacterium]